jgi:hypothetical protein
MKYIGLLFSILVLCGCASTNQTATYKYSISLKPSMSEEAFGKATDNHAMQLDLGVIPGALYGSPLKNPRWFVNLSDSYASNLNITKFEIELSKAAKTHDGSLPYSLNVNPADTKFVRVSTFGLIANSKTRFGGAFQNNSNEYVLLVYFDKACSVSGTVNFGKEGIYTHEIEIPKAGIYTLVISGSGVKKTVKTIQLSENLNVLLY